MNQKNANKVFAHAICLFQTKVENILMVQHIFRHYITSIISHSIFPGRNLSFVLSGLCLSATCSSYSTLNISLQWRKFNLNTKVRCRSNSQTTTSCSCINSYYFVYFAHKWQRIHIYSRRTHFNDGFIHYIA